MVTAWAGVPADSSAQPAGPSVLVILQNDAGVPPDVAARAQAEVVRLYGLIGVDIAWVTKVPEPDRRVRVVSLVKWEPAGSTCAAQAARSRNACASTTTTSTTSRALVPAPTAPKQFASG